MSLIIDAIQKAQQLRLREMKAVSFFRKPGLPGKGGKKPGKWVWIAGSAFGVVALLLFLLATHSLPLFASHQKQKPLPVEKVEKKGVEVREAPKNEIMSTSQIPEPPGTMAPLDQKIEDETLLKQPVDKKKRKVAALRPAEAVKKVPKSKKIKAGGELALAPSEAPAVKVPPPRASAPEEKKEKDRSQVVDLLANFNLGVSLYHQREVPKAIEAYQKVIEMDPTYVEAYNNLGVIYQDIGDFDQALGAYRKSIEVSPRYEKGYNNLGILLYLKGDHREAIQAFEKALALNANNIESYINLGILFKKEGQAERAIDYYRKALQINPMHGEAHYNIGLLYEEMENFESAVGHYQQFIRLGSKTYPNLVSKVQRHLNYLMSTRTK